MKFTGKCCLCGRPAEEFRNYSGIPYYAYLRSGPRDILCHECTLSAMMQEALMWPSDGASLIGELE